jgi:hypothetical protein
MRLTRETLLKFARESAMQRSRVSRRIVSIFLVGSLLEEAPLLGGTTDIDLVIIQDDEPLQQREIVRLTDEVHLDISHYSQALFRQPRHLRSDPWLGPFIYNKPLVYYDTSHWFDFTQAATGAQFFQPDYVSQRAGVLARSARQAWMRLAFTPPESQAGRVSLFFKAIEDAGNALASLNGSPLTERRFFLHLPQRLQALHQPDLLADLVHLFSPDADSWESAWPGWLEGWKADYQAAGSLAELPARLHPARQAYYARAAGALWEENPTAAAWLVLRTWTRLAELLPAGAPGAAGWQAAIQALRLDDDAFGRRLEELDRYLDRLEETLDEWARKNGVSTAAEI